MLTRAIVRLPGSNFADGLTTVDLGAPDFREALRQHEAYRSALEECGLAVTCLPCDEAHPDSTFVEDTAVLVHGCAILTRPGAASREGEVTSIRDVFALLSPDLREIHPPGTVDGGDVCEAGDHFLIGVSRRTNEEGAAELARHLAARGCTSAFVDIRDTPGILHLKSGLAYLGDGRFVAIEAFANLDELRGYEILRTASGEQCAANCIRINDRVLIPAESPALEATLRSLGYRLIVLDMSEFQKMDGGLSCLSLRF
jgi:dimethylargininase